MGSFLKAKAGETLLPAFLSATFQAAFRASEVLTVWKSALLPAAGVTARTQEKEKWDRKRAREWSTSKSLCLNTQAHAHSQKDSSDFWPLCLSFLKTMVWIWGGREALCDTAVCDNSFPFPLSLWTLPQFISSDCDSTDFIVFYHIQWWNAQRFVLDIIYTFKPHMHKIPPVHNIQKTYCMLHKKVRNEFFRLDNTKCIIYFKIVFLKIRMCSWNLHSI